MTVTTIDTSKRFATDKVAAAHVHEDKGPAVATSQRVLDLAHHFFRKDNDNVIPASDEAAADAYGVYKHKDVVMQERPRAALQSRQIDTFISGWGGGYRAVARDWAFARDWAVPREDAYENFLSLPERFPTVCAVLLECLMETRDSNAAQKSRDNALEELAELGGDAIEDGGQPPSPIAEESARLLIEKLARELPRDYSVSLVEDGDVAVYSSGGIGWRVSVYCRANGGASLYVTRPDEASRDSHYRSAQALPVNLIVDALKEMPK